MVQGSSAMQPRSFLSMKQQFIISYHLCVLWAFDLSAEGPLNNTTMKYDLGASSRCEPTRDSVCTLIIENLIYNFDDSPFDYGDIYIFSDGCKSLLSMF